MDVVVNEIECENEVDKSADGVEGVANVIVNERGFDESDRAKRDVRGDEVCGHPIAVQLLKAIVQRDFSQHVDLKKQHDQPKVDVQREADRDIIVCVDRI